MDEMQMLRDHHDAQPSPSPDAVVTARARLAAHTRPRRLPRLGRLSWGPSLRVLPWPSAWSPFTSSTVTARRAC
jgi:hypothetical protein